MRDHSGNSFIEPFPDLDYIKESKFARSKEEAKDLGLTEQQEKQIQKEAKQVKVDEQVLDKIDVDTQNAVSELPGPCPACGKTIITRSVIINIPYFKECILICSKCDECGYKSIEIQSAGEISKLGRRYTLHVTDPSDLSREVLKSNTCSIDLPDIGVSLSPGTLGGIYTTLEGLLCQIREELYKHSQFWVGDSSRLPEQEKAWKDVLENLQNMADGKRNFTIVIDDPLDSSFIKNIYSPDPDPEMKVETYKRTPEQDAEYGLDLCDRGE